MRYVPQHIAERIEINQEILCQDFAAFDSGLAEKWLITLTTELRKQLPQGQYILTHAREYLVANATGYILTYTVISRCPMVSTLCDRIPVFKR